MEYDYDMATLQQLYNHILTFLSQKFYTKTETESLLNGKSDTDHTHIYSNITGKPSTFTPSSHTHGNLQNNGQVGSTVQASKNVVTDSNGLITTEDKYTHPSYTARTGKPTGNQSPAFGGTATVTQVTSDATGHVTGMTDRTITIPATEATTTSKGLMSTTDKTKLNGIETGANKTTIDTSLNATSTNPVQNKIVKEGLDSKLNSSDFLETLNNAILDMNDA